MKRGFIICALLAASTLFGATAYAQSLDGLTPPQKQQLLAHLKAANDAFDDGAFETACHEYEEANQIVELRQTWYRLGQCRAELDQKQRAITAYRQFLKLEPDARDRGRVEAEIARLQEQVKAARIVTVRVRTQPAGASVLTGEGEKLGEAPVEAKMSPGKQTLVARLDGYYDARRVVDLEGGATTDVTLTLQPLTRLEVTSAPAGAAVRRGGPNGELLGETPLRLQCAPGTYDLYIARDGLPPVRRTADVERGDSVSVHVELREPAPDLRTPGWVTLGAGGAIGVVAVVFRQLAEAKIHQANEYDRSDPSHSRAELTEMEKGARRFETATWVAAGTSAIALVTGGSLLAVGMLRGSDADADVAVTITPGGAFALATVRF